MVRHTLLLLAVSLALVACNNNEANNNAAEVSDTTRNTAGVSAQDLSKGEPVALETVRFDTLRLRLKPNNRFTYRIHMGSTMVQDTNEVVKSEELTIQEDVAKVNPDGNALLRVLYKRMAVNAKVRNYQTKQVFFETSFDSKNKKDLTDSTKQQFAVMLETPIDVTVTPKAFMKEIAGIDPIARKIAATGPGGSAGAAQIPPEQFNQLKEMIKETLVATFLATTFAPLPDSSLTADGSWTRTQSQSMNPVMSSKSITKYKVNEVKKVNGHRLAFVSGTMDGTVTITPAPKGSGAPDFKLTTASIKGTSTFVVDLDTGVLISNKGNALSVIDGSMIFPGGQPRSILQRQELTVDTELLP